jgi:hypothetical protein
VLSAVPSYHAGKYSKRGGQRVVLATRHDDQVFTVASMQDDFAFF